MTINKALNLPSGYRIRTSVSGYIKVGVAWHDLVLVDLRFLNTDTLGQNAVYALKVYGGPKNGKWQEIPGLDFNRLAIAVITGELVEDAGKWGITR